jgi:hypothetical protein
MHVGEWVTKSYGGGEYVCTDNEESAAAVGYGGAGLGVAVAPIDGGAEIVGDHGGC